MVETTPILVLRLLTDGWFLERPEGARVFLGLPEAYANVILADA